MKKRRKKNRKKTLIIILVCAAVVLAASAVIVHFATRVTNESYANCSIGDVNGDGYINAIDSLLIIESTTDGSLLFENQKKLADVNNDGEVNSSDSLILLRYTVGEIDSIPYDDSAPGAQGIKTPVRFVETESNNLKFSADIENKWKNTDGSYSYQVSCKLKNSGQAVVMNWQTAVKFSGKTEITKEWDCKCTSKSGTVTIDGDYIYAMTESTFGFIVKGHEGLSIDSVSINK